MATLKDESPHEEEEEEAGSASPKEGEWILTEEDVMRERLASLERTETAKAHFKTQEGAATRINAKLIEHGEYDLLPGAQRSTIGDFSLARRFSGVVWPVMLLEGAGSAEQRRSARVVSEAILRRQERVQTFNLRRKQVLDENQQLQVQLASDLEAAEARCAQRQRERLLESRRRAFAAQQRRAEQQKVFRENQREQERIWESYYTSKERQAKGRPAGTRGGAQPKSSAGAEQSSWAEEEVYRTTLASHQGYTEAIERWRQFEKDNERRTEVHKKKLMQSAGYSGSLDEPEMGTQKLRHRMATPPRRASAPQAVTDEERVKWMFRRKGSTMQRKLAATDPLPTPELEDLPAKSSFMSASSSAPQVSIKSSRSLPSLASWESRKTQCDSYMEEKFQQSLRRLDLSQQSMELHRQRSLALTKDRVEKASELNKTWKERNDIAAKRRAELAYTSDEDLNQRLAEHARNREDFMRQAEEERHEASLARDERIQEARSHAERLVEQRVLKASEKVLSKEETSQGNIMAKLKEFEQRALDSEYEDILKIKSELRHSQSADFQAKARKEMEKKDCRSQAVLLQKRQSPMERMRAQRKARASSRTSTQRLENQLAPLDVPQASSVERWVEQPESTSSPSSLSLPALPGASGGLRGTNSQPMGELLQGGAEVPGRDRASSLVMSLPLDIQQLVTGEVEAEVAVEQHDRPSVLDGMDSDDEGLFLKELESRSVKWLHELRREKERSTWKP